MISLGFYNLGKLHSSLISQLNDNNLSSDQRYQLLLEPYLNLILDKEKADIVKRDRARAEAQYQGFEQGIKYAIAAIEDYQSSAEKLI